MALPDFRINPYIQPYQGGLSSEVSNALNQRIREYDANQEYSDVLGYQADTLMQNVAPFENDRIFANQLVNKTRENINTWAEQGDYENLGRAIRKEARTFSSQMQPLIENQKRYSDYLKNMDSLYREGKISIDTYNKAKQHAISNYKGIDPGNVQGSLFQGFTPSPDISVAKKVDEFLTGWKADGGSRLIPDGQGAWTEVKWEQAKEKDIIAAAQNYLLGDNEFKGYAQTQGAIGNVGRIDSEVSEAIQAGARKHGYYKDDRSIKWEPEFIGTNKASLQLARTLPSVASSATTNPGAINIFDGQGLKVDDLTGKLILSDLVSQENGKYYIFHDEKGNQISKADYETLEASRRRRQVAGEQVGINQSKNSKIEISAQDATKYATQANEQLANMAAERFLQESIKSGRINNAQLLNDQAFVNEYLRINQARYTSPKYLKETKTKYDAAIKNSQQIFDNKRWDISQIPGAASPEFTTLKDDDILANMTGQSIGILDTDIGGFRKGQRADLNSMLEKLQEDGYTVQSIRRLGPLQFNPYSNSPGMSYAFTLKDKDDKLKTMEVAASMNDTELQPIQDVYNLAYKGMSGSVPFYAPNSPLGAISGQLRVRTSIDTDSKDNKDKFTGFVEILDNQGNKLNVPGFPQNIPFTQFGEVYKQIFTPNVLQKYLNPKYTK